MNDMFYVLSGLKSTLTTSDKEIATSFLSDHICGSCFNELMSDKDSAFEITIDDMFSTACGAEWLFDEYECEEDYLNEIVRDGYYELT